MENAISVSLTTPQLILSLAIQIWIIVAPIIIIRKLNYLTSLLQERSSNPNQESS